MGKVRGGCPEVTESRGELTAPLSLVEPSGPLNTPPLSPVLSMAPPPLSYWLSSSRLRRATWWFGK
jgi:hypothetical protein